MRYKGIAHAAFKVTDMDKALRFYTQGLGFTQKFLLKDDNGRPWITYLEIVPGTFLELFYDYDGLSAQSQNDGHIGYLHLSIEVADIEGLRRELLARGVTLDSEITRGKDNSDQLWISDPDGNRIEFMEYREDSLQLQ